MNPELRELLGRLTELTDEELAGLKSALLAEVDRLNDDPEADAEENIAALAEVADGLDALAAEGADRTAKAAELAGKREATLERIRALQEPAEETPTAETPEETPPEDEPVEVPEPEPQPVEAEAEPAEVVDAELEPVAAAAPPARPRPSLGAIAAFIPDRQRPQERAQQQANEVRIVASAEIPGVGAGSELSDLDAVSEAVIARNRGFRGQHAGTPQNFYVASMFWDQPPERQVHDDRDPIAFEKAAKEANAVVAAGGICAPPTPLYDIPVIATDERPWKAMLPSVQATRGGITWTPPISFSAFSTAGIRATTAAQDLAGYTSTGGSTADKPCARVTCDPTQTVSIVAISNCLTFGNIQDRFYPEHVREYVQLNMAGVAKVSEEFLMAQVVAGSLRVTTNPNKFGVVRDLLGQAGAIVSRYRSSQRTGDNLQFTAMFPLWAKELLKTDIANGAWGGAPRDNLSISDGEVSAWFAARNVNVGFYLDESNPGSPPAESAATVLAAQTAAALASYPTHVRWFLFPVGTWVFLDGGQLDMGIVRDSTLNATNDFQMFAESFENVAKRGFQSLYVDSEVCATGASGGPITSPACPIP